MEVYANLIPADHVKAVRDRPNQNTTIPGLFASAYQWSKNKKFQAT